MKARKVMKRSPWKHLHCHSCGDGILVVSTTKTISKRDAEAFLEDHLHCTSVEMSTEGYIHECDDGIAE